MTNKVQPLSIEAIRQEYAKHPHVAHAGGDTAIPVLLCEIERLEGVIAGLKAPPGASAMERAKEAIARAISPQRWPNLNAGEESRELEEAEKLLARAIEQAEREARAAALEEVIDHICRNPGAHPTIVVVGMIRALAAKPGASQ